MNNQTRAKLLFLVAALLSFLPPKDDIVATAIAAGMFTKLAGAMPVLSGWRSPFLCS